MAFGDLAGGGRGQPRAEINMIPLIDVMLVLLVIFMVTAPLLKHAVPLELPRASSHPPSPAPKVDIAIDAAGQVYWNGSALAADTLAGRLQALAAQAPRTELHLAADRAVRYEHIAAVMAAASRAGVTGLAFVTQPAEP